MHNVPYCERSGTRIQPLLSRQWFVDVKEPAAKVLSALDSKEVTVYPERFVHDFHNRLDNVQPWCISRQLWWGHRIPVWKDLQGNNYVFDEDSLIAYAKKSKKKSHLLLSLIVFNLIADSRLPEKFSIEQLISILTAQSIVEQRGTVFETFMEVYKAKEEDFTDEIAELEKIFAEKSSIKEIEQLVDILDSATLIIQDKDQYSLDFVTLA